MQQYIVLLFLCSFVFNGYALTYCELYSTPETVFDTNQKNDQDCVVPPRCEDGKEDDKIDRPSNNISSSDKFCEELCDEKGENDGWNTVKDVNGQMKRKQCRVRPSCSNGEPMNVFDRYKVGKCINWCTERDSFIWSNSSHLRQSNTTCNQRLIYNPKWDGKVPEPFSNGNPYGARETVYPKDCTLEENIDTHNCLNPVSPPVVEEPSSIQTGTIALIAGGALLLIIIIVIGIVVGVIWMRKRKGRKIMENTDETLGEETKGTRKKGTKGSETTENTKEEKGKGKDRTRTSGSNTNSVTAVTPVKGRTVKSPSKGPETPRNGTTPTEKSKKEINPRVSKTPQLNNNTKAAPSDQI